MFLFMNKCFLSAFKKISKTHHCKNKLGCVVTAHVLNIAIPLKSRAGGGGRLPTFLKNRNTVHYSRHYPPRSPAASRFSRSFPTSSSSSSLVSLIEFFITSFTKVVYHTARRDEVAQRVNPRLILFFSFEPPKALSTDSGAWLNRWLQ